MKTEQEQIEAATMAIAREVCPYYNSGRCDLGSPTCHKTSIQLCSRKEAIIDSLNRIVKQAKIDVLNKLKDSYGLYYLSAFGVKERMLADILNPMIEELKK